MFLCTYAYGDENKYIVVIVVVYICIVQLSHGVVIEHRRICVHIPSQYMAFVCFVLCSVVYA
jgi:hypothetical protein